MEAPGFDLSSEHREIENNIGCGFASVAIDPEFRKFWSGEMLVPRFGKWYRVDKDCNETLYEPENQ